MSILLQGDEGFSLFLLVWLCLWAALFGGLVVSAILHQREMKLLIEELGKLKQEIKDHL